MKVPESLLQNGVIPHRIGNHPLIGAGGRIIPVTCPHDGSILGQVRVADAALVDKAVGEAREAFPKWSATPVKDRVQVLFRFKALLDARTGELAELVRMENGKTLAEAEAEVRRGIEVVEFAAGLPGVMEGQILEVSTGVDCYVRRYPLGVVAGATPFNFPAMVPMWMFPIAIGSGNAFILKPSEQVPITPLRLAELLAEAGLPEGAFSVVQGDGATVQALADHPDVQAMAFVGSSRAAEDVYHRATRNGKRALALGGAKNHLIVMPDADPETTADNIVSSAMGCAGQRCMAASVMVTVGECGPVIEKVVAKARAIRPGQEMGPVISAVARDRITGYVDRAERDGAVILVDGRNPDVSGKGAGYWVGPTVLDGLSPESACVKDEIFGPVLAVIRARTLDEALALEGKSPFGNAASIYTRDGAAAAYFADRVNDGMVGVNVGVPVPREPFSFGGWNASKFGIGDLTGDDGVRFWTKAKKITQKWAGRQDGF